MALVFQICSRIPFCDSAKDINALISDSKSHVELKIFRPPIIESPNRTSNANIKFNNIQMFREAIEWVIAFLFETLE